MHVSAAVTLSLLTILLPSSARAGKFKCDCRGTQNGGSASKTYVCHDGRLGPKVLPTALPLSGLFVTFDRFGGLTPGAWLANYTSPIDGSFIYPPQNGFQLDTAGNPIMGNMTLLPGTLVDRFGSEYGSYISAADAPYNQRALPPANLDTNPTSPDYPYNYHVYRVVKTLEVLGGPIAPWFAQPGLGTQFYTGGVGNIMTLLSGGYIERVDPRVLRTSRGEKKCF